MNDLSIVSSCPESCHSAPQSYAERVVSTARWCEEAGHDGLLIRSDNRLSDPWVLAQLVLQSTSRLRPVVTVQPMYQHPYTVAKKVVTLARMFGRAPDLNLVAGGFRADLLALDDSTRHDDRYVRLAEFGEVVQALLTSREPVKYEGTFYKIYKPTTLAPLGHDEQPRFLVPGSSEAGRAAARRLGALAVGHPVHGEHGASAVCECVRLGLIARPDDGAAWSEAHARFPENHGGRLAHSLEMRWTDSQWHQDLEQAVDRPESTLWLTPFEHRQSQVAYLVGDYRAVARDVAGLLRGGARCLLLDAPAGPEDVEHTAAVLRRAHARFASPLAITA